MLRNIERDGKELLLIDVTLEHKQCSSRVRDSRRESSYRLAEDRDQCSVPVQGSHHPMIHHKMMTGY